MTYEQISKLTDKTIDNVRSKNFLENHAKNAIKELGEIETIWNDYLNRKDLLEYHIGHTDASDYTRVALISGRFEAVLKNLKEVLYVINRELQDELLDKEIDELKRILTEKA